MSSIKIRPLHVGTITRQISNFCYRLDPGKSMDLALICWYIEGSDKKILVDAGGVDPAKANPRWLPYKREKHQSIENALERIKIKCEDIDVVIITHLHWDHAAGSKLFTNAKIIVQEKELQSARSPFPVSAGAYIKSIVEDTDYTVISGDKDIAEGVRVILTPGHTYGLQGVLVEGEKERYFIAGDTLGLYRNLEFKPPLISGSYVDLKKYYESLEKIGKLSAFILPGHDLKIFERETYS